MTDSLSTTLVVDVSVVANWYLSEPDSATAAGFLSPQFRLLAPELLAVELGNILWKKARAGDMDLTDAHAVLRQFRSARPVELRPSLPLLTNALDIAARLGRTVYDSLYVALAVARGCQLVTADERLVNALGGTPLAASVISLRSI